jgi:hypothetical protein
MVLDCRFAYVPQAAVTDMAAKSLRHFVQLLRLQFHRGDRNDMK